MNLFYKLATERMDELAGYWRLIESKVCGCVGVCMCDRARHYDACAHAPVLLCTAAWRDSSGDVHSSIRRQREHARCAVRGVAWRPPLHSACVCTLVRVCRVRCTACVCARVPVISLRVQVAEFFLSSARYEAAVSMLETARKWYECARV
jgi:hypothetical protein